MQLDLSRLRPGCRALQASTVDKFTLYDISTGFVGTLCAQSSAALNSDQYSVSTLNVMLVFHPTCRHPQNYKQQADASNCLRACSTALCTTASAEWCPAELLLSSYVVNLHRSLSGLIPENPMNEHSSSASGNHLLIRNSCLDCERPGSGSRQQKH